MSTYKIYRESDYRKDAIDLLKDLSIKYGCAMYLDGCMEGIPVNVICIGNYKEENEVEMKKAFANYLSGIFGSGKDDVISSFDIGFPSRLPCSYDLTIMDGTCFEITVFNESDYREDIVSLFKKLSSEFNTTFYFKGNCEGVPMDVYTSGDTSIPTLGKVYREYTELLSNIYGDVILLGEPIFNVEIYPYSIDRYDLKIERSFCSGQFN